MNEYQLEMLSVILSAMGKGAFISAVKYDSDVSQTVATISLPGAGEISIGEEMLAEPEQAACPACGQPEPLLRSSRRRRMRIRH